MKLFNKNKKTEEIQKDENGNVIELNPKTTAKVKGFIKGTVIGLAAATVGVITFCVVGLAMTAVDENSSDTVEAEDDEITVSDDENSEDGSATGTTGDSEK